ncbi:MAG: (Fe-S)-binding protein [Puniceicoccales bacterium]|jgi:L-lactate dehydrogenase complex protein LldE|nr:(Fe-S)-binding protein [Puniceicoccales bacterium]
MADITFNRPAGKRVQLMATCLCDAFFDDAAAAVVEVLEHLGCEIDFPEDQTCCGQPAFNSGDWNSSRKVVRHALKVFSGDAPVIVPSASCAAMMFHGALLAFEKEPDYPAMEKFAGRVWEFTDYIVNGLGIKKWPGRYNGTVAFHRSCHSRGTNTGPAALALLESIEGLKVLPFGESEQCCGFGGTFSVTFPNISKSMGELKLDHILAAAPDQIVSIDQSCLMNLSGLAAKGGRPIKTVHIAQILRDALKNPAK